MNKALKNKIESRSWVKFASVTLLFFIIGCEGPSDIKTPAIEDLQNKRAMIIRRMIMDIQETEKAQIREFNNDMKILRKRNPFSLSTTIIAEGPSLRLGGIMWDREEPVAVINDMIVAEGDMIDDKRIKKITQDTVILIEKDGKEHILRLKFQ